MTLKKHSQLGMNSSTASHRLVKDLLFSFVKDTPCYHCGGTLERENFSIEHKVPWLDSEDPKGLFFDLDNISYSHLSCNVKAARRNKVYEDGKERSRVEAQRWRDNTPKEVQKLKRRKHYLATGK